MAKQPTPFRVTLADVESAIKGKPTYTKLPSGKKIVCELTLQNGFTVIGVSSVVDIRNHVEKIGREVALRNAKDEVWKFLGYTKQTELANALAAEIAATKQRAKLRAKKQAARKTPVVRKPRAVKPAQPDPVDTL